MNICLIGYGSIARFHVKALSSQGVTFHTVMGRLAEPTAEFAREFGFRHHTVDLAEALASPEVEAVVITSPSDAHAAQTEAALRAGKHVLCEIPLATSLAEADRLTALANQSDRRLMICHTHRFDVPFSMLHDRVTQGRLHIHHVVVRYSMLRRENVNWMGRRRSWTDNLIWHHGGHVVDICLWLLGATEATVASQVARPSRSLDIPLDLSVMMRTPRDQLVTIGMSYNNHLATTDYLVIGEEDSFRLSGHRLTNRDGVLYEPGPPEEGIAPAVAAQDAEFVAAVREGREPMVSGRSIRPALAVLQEVQEEANRVRGEGLNHSID